MKASSSFLAASILALSISGTAHAELAPPLRAMLDSAIASGNDTDISTISKYLKKTDPSDAAEVDKIIADHKTQAAATQKEKLAHEDFLQGWKGQGQIGFSQTSGNTDTLDLSAGLKLTREGLYWRQNLHAMIDYQRSYGITTASQILAGWEPDYKISDRLFIFGLAQYERNRFAGFDNRETLGGGLGDRVVATPNFTLDLKAGPTWQRTAYVGEASDSALAAYGAINAAWKIGHTLALTEDASATYSSINTAFTSNTALTAKINSALSASIGYQVTYNSNPPPGFKDTDTLTRFALVYGF